MACATNGDLFCRECAVSDLLAQRKEIKRLEKEWEREKAEQEDEGLRRNAEAKEKEVKEFEATMAGYGEKRKRENDDLNGNTKKRKSSDAHEVSKPSTSQSFWVPGLTPSDSTNSVLSKPPKLNPVCPASKLDAPHPYSLKSLIEVHFSEEAPSSKSSTSSTPTRICPSCKKALSNASKAMLTKPCGHVICKSCTDQFMKPAEGPDPHTAPSSTETDTDIGKVLCYVCETDITERLVKKEKGDKEKIKPGLVAINVEGTGFAGGGSNMARKEGVAFQC